MFYFLSVSTFLIYCCSFFSSRIQECNKLPFKQQLLGGPESDAFIYLFISPKMWHFILFLTHLKRRFERGKGKKFYFPQYVVEFHDVWWNLLKFSEIVKFDVTCWMSMIFGKFDDIWWNLMRSGKIRCYVVKFDDIWWNSMRFGELWLNSIRSGKIRWGLVKFGKIW